jgi:hypothetical protein
MNMHYAHQGQLIHQTERKTLAQLQLRRRRTLGLLLIIFGSIWFGLRLFGFVGNLCLPGSWLEATGLVRHLLVSEQSQPELLAACGMLASYTIQPSR